MGAKVNGALLTCLLGWLSYELHGLYLFCQPPVVAEDAAGAVIPDLSGAGALDVHVLLGATEEPAPRRLLQERAGAVSELHMLLGTFEGVQLEDSDKTRDLDLQSLSLPEAFYGNRTLFLHAIALPHGQPGAKPLRQHTERITRQVVQPERRISKRYLLGPPAGAPEIDFVEAAIGDAPVASLPRVVEVGFVAERRAMDGRELRHRGMHKFVKGSKVRLPLHVNTLVSPRDEYVPLVKGAPTPSLELRLRSISMAIWTMQLQLSTGFVEAEKTMGLNEYDVDSFKQVIGGSAPWKIGLVYGVGVLHLIFEYLAFSSDIQFWRKKTSFEGLSSSSVMMQACMTIIMFFYIQEQGQTKFVLYLLAGRLCLQIWKLSKLTTFERCRGWPFVRWVARGSASDGLEELQDIGAAEAQCMRGVVVALLPVVVAFCTYRLLYVRFRSWHSWLVLSLAVCAQVGGFVVMTPQVFLNYRLKSVEHLPWRALTYQAINTFVDDVFMLCIRMPEVQKYSVFRDDIIFFICLGQRWYYKKTPIEGAMSANTAAGGTSDGSREKVD